MGRSLLDRPIGRPACGANNEARRKKKELGAKSETAMMAHARSGSKPARISHRAITSSARRVLRPTDQGAIMAASPIRRFAPAACHLSKAVITIITTSTRMKLRSSQRGRSGPDNVTQATIARIRQINDQESIVRKRCVD
jgi:hypothetical protein